MLNKRTIRSATHSYYRNFSFFFLIFSSDEVIDLDDALDYEIDAIDVEMNEDDLLYSEEEGRFPLFHLVDGEYRSKTFNNGLLSVS